MNLKNYTSNVSVSSSISRIEHDLVRSGATNISKHYNEDSSLDALMFQLTKNGVPIPIVFRLPAKWQTCFKVMWNEVRRPRPETKKRIEEQAQRTAWKLMQDWVEVQLSLIKLEQAEAIEIFLPYAYDPETNQTYFENLKATGFKQLTGSTK